MQKRVICRASPRRLSSRLADLSGRLTRRPMPEGTARDRRRARAPLLIHRGQNVTLAARAGGIEVRAPGRALADAAANQRLRVAEPRIR